MKLNIVLRQASAGGWANLMARWAIISWLSMFGLGQALSGGWSQNIGAAMGTSGITVEKSVTDSAGNIYVVGYFSGATSRVGSFTLTRIGNSDAFVAKMDAAGKVLWAKNFGGTGANLLGHDISVDSNGNVYLCGEFYNGNLTTPMLTKMGDYDAFAFKLDSSGNLIWYKNFGGAGAIAKAKGIAVDSSGNVYLGGDFYNSTNFNITTPAMNQIGGLDAFVIKLNSAGGIIWSKNFGGSSPYQGLGAGVVGSDIAVDGSGNVYLAGDFTGQDLTIPALPKIGTYAVDRNALIIKLNSSGNTVWAKNYGGTSANAFGRSIAVDGSGGVYFGGYFAGNLTTPALTKFGLTDAFAIKLDGSGNTIWVNHYGGENAHAFGHSISVDNSSNVYLGGYFTSNSLTTPPLSRKGGSDVFTIKLSSAGTTTWAKNYGGIGATAIGRGIAVDGSGNVYLGGDFSSASLTTPALNKIGSQDAFTFKLSSSGNTIWTKQFSDRDSTLIRSVATDSAGNTYVAGSFSVSSLSVGGVTLTRIGTYQNAFAAKFDASGTVVWAKNYGGSGAWSEGWGIAVDVDPDGPGPAVSSGNVYLSGTFGNANLTTPALSKIGTWDAFVFKLDSSGNTTWAKNYGGNGAYLYASPSNIRVDGSGNVYLGGYFQSANLTTPLLSKIGNQDLLAIKLNSSGNTVWAKNFGGSGVWSNETGIGMDGVGNVYLSGYFNSGNFSTPSLTKIGNNDVLVIKLDNSGSTVWAKNYGGSGASAYASDIVVDGGGNSYVGGFFDSANLTTPSLTKIGIRDSFALKLDSTGAASWVKNFGGSGANVGAYGVALDVSDNFYMIGYFDSADLTTPSLTRIGSGDAYILMLDNAGNTAWAKNYGGAGTETYTRSIAVDSSGNVHLGGYFNSANLTSPALIKIGSEDAFLFLLSGQAINFAAISNKSLGAANFSISGTANSGLVVTFSSQTPGICTVTDGGTINTTPITSVANVHLVAAGTCTIRASQGGNANYTAATPVDQSFTVYGLPVASMTVNPNPGACGQSMIFDGSSSYQPDPSRSIVQHEWDFNAANGLVYDAVGTSVTHAYPAFGTYTVTLRVTDDNSPPLTATTTTNVVIDQGNHAPVANAGGPYTTTYGTGANLNGSGSTDADSACGDSIVSYQWDLTNDGHYDATGISPNLTWANLNSYGISSAGSYTTKLRVTDSFSAIGSATVNLTVNPATPTVSFNSPPTSKNLGDADFGVSAIANSGGTITYSSDTASVCTVAASGTVHLLSVGTCTVRAAAAATINYISAYATANITVGKQDQTIAFTTLPDKIMGDADFPVSAAADSGLTVNFASQTATQCTLTDNGNGTATVHLAGRGTCTIRASQTGNASYNAAPSVDRSFFVYQNVGLNDSGQTLCYDNAGATVACTSTTHPRQDGRYGRDPANPTKIGGGNAGFDYTSLDANGNPTTPSSGATPHPCVRDNVTGLVWEVKNADGGTRDQGWRYTWFSSDTATNGGNAGIVGNTSSCSTSLAGIDAGGGAGLSNCNTANYVAAINSMGLCGYGDWRLPTRKELASLLLHDRTHPMIEPAHFPNTALDYYWTATTFASNPAQAWYIHFGGGVVTTHSKDFAHVRLVRGGQ